MRDPLKPGVGIVIVNAQVWSPGQVRPRKGAIAIGDGRIVRVGNNSRCEAEAGDSTRIIDINNRLVVPGFVDAHAHLLHTGPRMDWLQLQRVRSKRRLLADVTKRAGRSPRGDWVLGREWDESEWPERTLPSREELDIATGGRPVLLRRIDGHLSLVNKAALKILRIPKDMPGLERNSRGIPTGVLKGKANELAGKHLRPSPAELVAAFPRMQRMAHRLGITSVHDIVDERGLAAYLALSRGDKLGLRVCTLPMFRLLPGLIEGGTTPGPLNDWLRIGPVKIFSDGSLGARTAALCEEYADAPKNRGKLEHRPTELKGIAKRAHRSGFQLAVHAIGDKAIDVSIDAIESAVGARPRDDHRHRIEHFELPSIAAIERCKESGIIPVMQPNFVVTWSQVGGMYEDRLGVVRAKRNNPHRLILRHGLCLAFGSDGMPYGPLYGLRGAVEPPYPNQRIPLHKALEAYTLAGAFATFEENVKGRIESGYLADLAIIDGRWSGASTDITKWKVAGTVVGGRFVYLTAGLRTPN